jgi:hypothetical protein
MDRQHPRLMSLSARHVDEFDSFVGRTVTFLVDNRKTNSALARCLVTRLVRKNYAFAVLDVDALYASNSEYIFGSLPEDGSQRVDLLIPETGSDLKDEIGTLLAADSHRILIFDSLNSVFHLLPAEGHGSRNRNLVFAMSLLSYLSRVDGRTILFTMYERGSKFGGKNPISGLSDVTIDVSLGGDVLTLKDKRGLWQERVP